MKTWCAREDSNLWPFAPEARRNRPKCLKNPLFIGDFHLTRSIASQKVNYKGSSHDPLGTPQDHSGDLPQPGPHPLVIIHCVSIGLINRTVPHQRLAVPCRHADRCRKRRVRIAKHVPR
jgi:hypothetical protein